MNTIRHLNTIIRRMEDNLLTSKNPYEIEGAFQNFLFLITCSKVLMHRFKKFYS